MPNLGVGETVVIIVLVFILFGPKRIPEIARSIGEGIRELKKSVSGLSLDELTKSKGDPKE